jgi:hypothetical protein
MTGKLSIPLRLSGQYWWQINSDFDAANGDRDAESFPALRPSHFEHKKFLST